MGLSRRSSPPSRHGDLLLYWLTTPTCSVRTPIHLTSLPLLNDLPARYGVYCGRDNIPGATRLTSSVAVEFHLPPLRLRTFVPRAARDAAPPRGNILHNTSGHLPTTLRTTTPRTFTGSRNHLLTPPACRLAIHLPTLTYCIFYRAAWLPASTPLPRLLLTQFSSPRHLSLRRHLYTATAIATDTRHYPAPTRCWLRLRRAIPGPYGLY